ncbi:LYR motif-containing protein 1 isoform X3 [Petaurus breviceps papuanus]|uniref:LYR motif-containing protein 1 isoform X3 n=1 Tax=Petaurus breviceps papuanus TaxID=3040969 RepID=UPI0036D80DC8
MILFREAWREQEGLREFFVDTETDAENKNPKKFCPTSHLFLFCPLKLKMTTATRQEVLSLYRRIFRITRRWRAASGQMEDTLREKQYIINEARTLFQKNKNLTDSELIKQCIDECTARIEIGLHYQIPYPRPIHLPPTALTPLQSRGLQTQEKLRRLSKPLYLKSHNEVS